jgi:cytochrome c peroxidase
VRPVILFLAAAGCFGQALTRPEAYARARDLTALGRRIFFDTSLSASGAMSCATCHDPRFAYGPPEGRQTGRRAVPSLRYLQAVPQFTEHYFDAENTGDDSVDNGPTGGLTWDGRVDRGRDQARLPLMAPDEMGNASPAVVVAAALKTPYGAELRRLTRDDIFGTILEALEAWEQDSREFYPYSSRYDAWLGGKSVLSEQERRGLKLFTDPAKGNCAQCHPANRGTSGTPPQFTDYGMIALGVPRNPEIAANANPAWFDLGLCGPERRDFLERSEYCGRFRTPSLRNVALRKSFFHNGVFRTLREAVRFYVTREVGKADLPEKYRSNVEAGPPFPEHAGDKPALSEEEIDDVVAFLGALTDQL